MDITLLYDKCDYVSMFSGESAILPYRTYMYFISLL